MKKIFSRIISSLLCLVLVIGLLPVQVHAGWDDGVECEYCGGYRFDDWLCECGPHCSETADEVECYFNHHCANCLESCDERCDECDLCEECQKESEQHCAECYEHSDDMCGACGLCENCQESMGTHCGNCGECFSTAQECPKHPLEWGNSNNHCADCLTVCDNCGDCAMLDCLSIDDLAYCEDCGLCIYCSSVEGLHCGNCYECRANEICEDCEYCVECAVELGTHCPECEEHVEEWCEQGGEGTHCMECADEYRCEQCEECTSCNDVEICGDCGFCEICCRENAEDEGCSCGEYCVNSNDFIEHFCPDCNVCYDEVDACEYCGLCLECCESYSDCSEGMCVENPEYTEHFCLDCNQCFHDVNRCEYCEDALEILCEDCCEEISYTYGCAHGYCANSWEWNEHFCESCQCCYGTGDCEHSGEPHAHNFDDKGRCTICGAASDGKPYITRQPKEENCGVTDMSSENPEENCVTFTVKAVGDNLSYRWLLKDEDSVLALNDDISSGYEDCIAYSGTKTNQLTVWVQPDACNHTYQFLCEVSNEKGTVSSDLVTLNAEHVYKKFEAVLGAREYFFYYNAEEGKKDAIIYQKSNAHVMLCVGEGCETKSPEKPHRYGTWIQGALPTKAYVGYKYRECIDCGYVDYSVLMYVAEPHLHDYSYAYLSDATNHWGQCACAEEDQAHKEVHIFGEWQVTKEGTTLSKGEEARSCSVCGYTQKRETEMKGHTHVYYDWDYISENGYLGEEVWPYQEPYGKTTKHYHFAYCLVEGCDAEKKEIHQLSGKHWITLPNSTEDGVYWQQCESCFYETGGTCKAGYYPIYAKDCNVNKQTAKSGMIVKLSPYEQYDPPYYFNDYIIYYTTDLGKTWDIIQKEYNREEDYTYFTMPEIPEDAEWTNVWVEIEAELIECGSSHDHKFVWKNEVKETCGESGYTGDYICEYCNYIEEAGQTVPPTEEHHASLKNVVEAGCTQRAYSGDLICDDCGKVLEKGTRGNYEHKPWFRETTKERVEPTCKTPGSTEEVSCRNCGTVVERSKTLPKIKHQWKGVAGTPSSCCSNGTKFHYECYMCDGYSYDKENVFENESKLFNYTKAEHQWCTAEDGVNKKCAVCGVSQEFMKDKVTRIFGQTRYQTSYAIADALKQQLGLDKFATVVIASGKNFPDALAGSYLANKVQAPILMASEKTADTLAQYLEANLIPGGKIYVLGGEAAVPDKILETFGNGYKIKRLSGQNRYDTNLEILKEAGVGTEDILICTGKGFADSLSVSATGKPILLVGKTLTEKQKTFLESVRRNQFYIIGGTGAVSNSIENELKAYGGSKRISGNTRYETSAAVANEFFDVPGEAVLAYAKNFPDGLCGGPLAYSKNTPLILTANGKQNVAVEYTVDKNILYGCVLGGDSLIYDITAQEILGAK